MAQRTAKKWLEQDSWNSGVRSSTDPLLKKHWQNWTKLSKTNISEFWNGPKVQFHWKWTEGIQQIEICLFKKKNPKSWVITVGVHGVLAWNCFQPLTQHHQLQRSTRVAASSENQGYWFRYWFGGILLPERDIDLEEKVRKSPCSWELSKCIATYMLTEWGRPKSQLAWGDDPGWV